MRQRPFRPIVLIIAVLFGILVALLLPAIPQQSAYHHFADRRTVLGIRYFADIVSNLPFIVIGALGLLALFFKPTTAAIEFKVIAAYRLFFAAIVGVGIGSGYYHHAPSNDTLVWDRLPMAVAFTAFFTIILAEYVSAKWAVLLFYPLVSFGIGSVIYWYLTELQGQGDLRFYGLVQLLPIFLTPLILVLYSARFTSGSGYWLILVLYVLAKVAETYDTEIYKALGLSGHTLKHLLAALACAVFLVLLKVRRSVHD